MRFRVGLVLMCAVFVVLTTFVIGPGVSAQPTQVSATVNLNYLNIQVTYPSEALPGDTVTAHVQANAQSSFYLNALSAQVFYGDGTNIRQLVTKTLASNTYVSAGNSLSGDIQFTVPQDAPRTSLIAAFSERTQVAYYDYSYSYYPYAYSYVNYSSPYSYNCSDPYYCSYPYSYYTAYYYAYPSYSYSTATDVGITSLPYIKATTPEQQSLQSQIQQLQQQFAQSQADNQKLQSDNQKLQQDLQNAQSTIAQQNSAAADMNQQLISTRNLSLGLGALAVILGILAVRFRSRSKGTSIPPQTTPSTPTQQAV